MLSTALKNTILIVLIVLIMHFFIKNQLASRVVTNVTAVNEKKETFDPKPSHAPISAHPIQPEKEIKNDEEELLKYVLKSQPEHDMIPSCPEVKTEIPSVDTLNAKMPKPVSQTAQTLDNMMLIGSYDDESGMNGGSVFGGLQGFDDNSVSYFSFSPTV